MTTIIVLNSLRSTIISLTDPAIRSQHPQACSVRQINVRLAGPV